MNVKEKFNSKLLVEGNDDQHVIWALCEKFNLVENFDVVDCQGVDKLFDQIPIRFKQSGVKTIGVIIDADVELKKRWQSLKTIFSDLGFDLPELFPAKGLIAVNKEGIKVGVWIMPGNDQNGMLEDFISFLVPEEDRLLPIVNSTLQSIEDQGLNGYSLLHKSKAVIHTWLSWQKDPGTPMGQGITKKYLSTDQETCLKLIEWLTELFKQE